MNKKLIYIMATGPSINDITDEEWKYLETQNTLGISKFPMAGKKTSFYYSHEGFKWQKDPLDLIEHNGYFDTTLLLNDDQTIKYVINLGFKKVIKTIKGSALFLPGRKGWFMNEPKPPYKFKVCRAKNLNEPIFRFRGTLASSINIALILGATEIRLVGVDLNSYWSFYDENDKWLTNPITKKIKNEMEEHQIKSMDSFKKGYNIDKNNFHKTAIPYTRKDGWVAGRVIRPIQDIVQWMDKEIREEGMDGIYVSSKDSLLYKENKLEYKCLTKA